MPTKTKRYGAGKYGGKRTGAVKRSAAVRVVQKAVRASLARKRRGLARVARPLSNAKAILSNSRKIQSLQKQQWGPIQQCRTYTDLGNKITANSPWCFHVTCPTFTNTTSPHIYHRNALGVASSIGQFKLHTGPMNSEDADRTPNLPCFLKSVMLEFEFSGFVDDTHIRIDVIRQKNPSRADYYLHSNSVADNLLPKALDKFTNLAGFTLDRLDRSAFEVVATKKLYMNSRPKNPTLQDVTQTVLGAIVNDNYPTTPATTPPVKRTKIYVPINKKLRPLDHQEYQNGTTDTYMSFTGVEDRGVFSYANQAPRDQLWCVISTSDKTALDSAFTGDAVECNIHRTVTWRDPHT